MGVQNLWRGPGQRESAAVPLGSQATAGTFDVSAMVVVMMISGE